MAEDEAALGKMMEEIKVNLPRFDQCISLLRTEIGQIKAGKLDHRLREVAATPLVDPGLHSALSDAVRGGLSLPPAPSLSDSEVEDGEDDDEGHKNKDGDGKGDERENIGGVGVDDEGEAGGSVALSSIAPAVQAGAVVPVAEPKEDTRGTNEQMRQAEEKRENCIVKDTEKTPGLQKSGDTIKVPPTPADGSANAAVQQKESTPTTSNEIQKEADPTPTAPSPPSSPRDEQPPKVNGCLKTMAAAAGTTAVSENENTYGETTKNNSLRTDSTCASAQNGALSDSHTSPIRDRPPILSGGGARVAPAAPPPFSAFSTPSSKHRGTGAATPVGVGGGKGRDAQDGNNDRAGGDKKSSSSARDSAMASAGNHASHVPKIEKNSRSGFRIGTAGGTGSRGGGDGKEKESVSGSKRGKKRPRVVKHGSAEKDKSARDRRPRTRIEGGGDDCDEDDEEEEEEEDVAVEQEQRNDGKEDKGVKGKGVEVQRDKPDSTDAEHFRRTALEVWDRVYRHKFAIIFRKPVNPKDAPGYEKVIKKPMDLSLIRQRIMSGALLSLDDMSRDLFVMCTNAMVFNGKGDPYFDYSKELRTYAHGIIEEARRPAFVTADPGFDSVIRTSRARQEATPSRSASRGRGRGGAGAGGGGSSGRRSSRESDTASVADDTGDEGSKGRRGGGGRGRGKGGSARGGDRKRGSSTARKPKEKKKVVGRKRSGRTSPPVSSEAESVGFGENSEMGSSEDETGGDEEGEERKQEGENGEMEVEEVSSASDIVVEKKGKKRSPVGKSKKRAREGTDGSSSEEPSTRGKGRKAAKPSGKRTPTSKAREGKKRTRSSP